MVDEYRRTGGDLAPSLRTAALSPAPKKAKAAAAATAAAAAAAAGADVKREDGEAGEEGEVMEVDVKREEGAGEEGGEEPDSPHGLLAVPHDAWKRHRGAAAAAPAAAPRSTAPPHEQRGTFALRPAAAAGASHFVEAVTPGAAPGEGTAKASASWRAACLGRGRAGV